MFNQLPHHENIQESGGIAPHILNFSNRWRWVVSYMSLLLNTPRKVTPSPQAPIWTGGWVGPGLVWMQWQMNYYTSLPNSELFCSGNSHHTRKNIQPNLKGLHITLNSLGLTCTILTSVCLCLQLFWNNKHLHQSHINNSTSGLVSTTTVIKLQCTYFSGCVWTVFLRTR